MHLTLPPHLHLLHFASYVTAGDATHSPVTLYIQHFNQSFISWKTPPKAKTCKRFPSYTPCRKMGLRSWV